MLSLTDRRYTEIVSEKIASDKTHNELAKQFDVSVSTVKTAIQWGKEQGLFDSTLAEKLERHIAEYRGLVAETEKLLLRRIEAEEKLYRMTGELLPAAQFSFIMQRLETQREKLMELEGVYQKKVNVQIQQDNRVVVLPSRMNPQEWENAIAKFAGRRNESQKDLAIQGRAWINPADGLYAGQFAEEDSEENSAIDGTYTEEGLEE